VLVEFFLCDADDLARGINDQRTAAGGSLIERKYVSIGHDMGNGWVR
jgi:hypothetical protein